MNQNERRRKFAEQFAVNVNEIQIKKIIEQFAVQTAKIRDFKKETEEMKPSIEELANGYRSYISDLGGGFLEIAETYNEALQIARLNGIIKNVKLKARIKDFSSSISNTDKKLLDDMFGIEIVTGKKVENSKLENSDLEKAEFEKEILILFNHLLFDINKDKIYNKKSGYNAYHGMGDFSPKEGDLKGTIKKVIRETKTREYKYSKSEPKYNSQKNMVNVFPRLIKYINNKRNLERLTDTLSEMIEYMKTINISKENTPIIEFHFLTTEVEKEAIDGGANHSKYKKINPTLIEKYFLEGRLIRGINAPWKFESNGENFELQDVYKTFKENYPFLADEIEQKQKLGKDGRERERMSKFDRLTATQFPFLRKYLSPNNNYDKNIDENWGFLKAMIVANRIDFNDKSPKSIEDEIVNYVG